jgi:hypothetical protein
MVSQNLRAVHKYRRNNRDKVRTSARKAMRKWKLLAVFGLTMAQYNAILKSQNGRCAICGRKPRGTDRYRRGRSLAVDHDHKTKRVRGLLCDMCNRALGQFRDSVKIVRAALAYLIKREGKRSRTSA